MGIAGWRYLGEYRLSNINKSIRGRHRGARSAGRPGLRRLSVYGVDRSIYEYVIGVHNMSTHPSA